MEWMLPLRTLRAASQVRCQRGSGVGKRGAGLGASAAAVRASEGRKVEAPAREASWRNCLREAGFIVAALFVYIFELEHGEQALFFFVVEAAGGFELLRVLVCAEEHIPPDDIAV